VIEAEEMDVSKGLSSALRVMAEKRGQRSSSADMPSRTHCNGATESVDESMSVSVKLTSVMASPKSFAALLLIKPKRAVLPCIACMRLLWDFRDSLKTSAGLCVR
jgi:hypothetical protein